MTVTKLPVQLTSFIGHERELTEVKRLVSTSQLVTLTGARGCGSEQIREGAQTKKKCREVCFLFNGQYPHKEGGIRIPEPTGCYARGTNFKETANT